MIKNSIFEMLNSKQTVKDGSKVWVGKQDLILAVGLVNCFVNKTCEPYPIPFLNLNQYPLKLKSGYYV